MPKASSPLVVTIHPTADALLLEAGPDVIRIKTSHPSAVAYPDRADFAVFFFLPIAMRTGRPLRIQGAGSDATVQNATRMSHIWATWLPERFAPVSVSFDALLASGQSPPRPSRDLCLYSGGIDSVFTLLTRRQEHKQQDLLTVFGMDYKLERQDRFKRFLEHTAPFARHVSPTRIIVEMDAYNLYRKYRINPRHHELTHVFALAGSAFLHATDYTNIYIASDFRLDQQFLSHPWSNNSVTNPLFNDGSTRLLTDSDALSRSEKLPLILQSPEALASLTFCLDEHTKPANCGTCPKCMRTKLMFLARTDVIPPLFLTDHIPRNWMRSFVYEKPADLAFLMETIHTARLHGNADKIPFFAENERRLLAFCRTRSHLFSTFRVTSWLRRKRLKLQHVARKFRGPQP
jgi:hypothetical protein